MTWGMFEMLADYFEKIDKNWDHRVRMRRAGADPDEMLDMALQLAQLGVTSADLPGLVSQWLMECAWPPPYRASDAAFEKVGRF